MKKRALAGALGCLLTAALVHAMAEPAVPNLAGMWRPDRQRSSSEKTLKPAAGDPSVAAPPASASDSPVHPLEKIEQAGTAIRVILHDDQGQPTNTLVLSTDGKETRSEMAGGALIYAATSRWEGGSLVVEWKMERGGKPMIWGKDIRTLEGPDTQRLVRDLEDAKSRTHSVIVLRRSA